MMPSMLVEYLINAAWQVPLVMVGALVVSRWGGLTPAARNLAWLGFLAMAVISPALPIEVPTQTPAPSHAAQPLSMAGLTALAPVAADLNRANPLRLVHIALDARSAGLIHLAFAAVAAIALARLAVAAVAAQRLVRRARETILDDPVSQALERFAAEHGRKTPVVLMSGAVQSPAVVGVIRPVILIPSRFGRLASEDQTAALLHECAHVLRRDYAVNLLCEAFVLPLSWHPALYQIKAGVRRSRELACDAMAATAMASEEAYARSLLSLAKALGGRPEPANTTVAAAAYVGLFGKSDLEDRLMHLLTPKGGDEDSRKVVRLGAAATLAALALAPTMLVRVAPALAQTAPIAPRSTAAPLVAQSPMLVHVAAAAEPAAPPAPPTPPVPPVAAAPAEPPRRVGAHHCPNVERTARVARQDAGVSDATDADEDRFAGVVIGPNGRFVGVSEKDRARLRADQRRLEAEMHRATQRVAEAQRRLDSPEFKQKMADMAAKQAQFAALNQEKLRGQMEAATKAVAAANVQAALAESQARIAAATAERESRTAERERLAAERESRAAERESQAAAAQAQRDIERSMHGMALDDSER